jgi:hypothetical protein
MSDIPAENRTAGTPWHLWVVGIVSLLWNGLGAFDYLMTRMRADWYVAQFTPEQIAYFDTFPLWVDISWALGVWGAVLGSIGLLMRKTWAVWAFGISLVGMLLTTIYTFLLTDGLAIMGGSTGIILFNVAIWAVGILLFGYAAAMKNRGVLS